MFLALFVSVAGTIVETGSTVRAVVLDVAKAEHLVDLSLKQQLTNKLKEESVRSRTHKKVRTNSLPLSNYVLLHCIHLLISTLLIEGIFVLIYLVDLLCLKSLFD